MPADIPVRARLLVVKAEKVVQVAEEEYREGNLGNYFVPVNRSGGGFDTVRTPDYPADEDVCAA